MKRILAIVASVLVVAGLAYGVHELMRVPPHKADRTSPLTDVAGSPRTPEIGGVESPQLRQAALADAGNGAPGMPPDKVVMPTQMPDVEHPPQWTQPRALPPPPNPPDPFVPPPIAVDPTRGHHTNAE